MNSMTFKKEKRKIAIWGTGDIATKYTNNLRHLPDYYIDNNIEKKGTEFKGVRILHPSEIDDYSKIYIVIANTYYSEIKDQLLSYGLEENRDFIYYARVIDNQKQTEMLIEDVKKRKAILLENFAEFKNKTLIFGGMVSFDTKCIDYYNYANQLYKNEFLLMSETSAIIEKDKIGLIKFPYFTLPEMFTANYHLKENCFSSIEEAIERKEYIEKEDYRRDALKDFEGKNKQVAKEYASYFIYEADLFLREILEWLSPKQVYIWNMYYPFHILIDSICKEKSINIAYIEFGSIAGTYNVEKTGQMGESYIAKNPDKFKQLPIDEEDVLKANAVYEYLKTSRINRKVQPDDTELETVLRKLDKRKPIIAYVGQNDYESGIYPYTERTRKYHSPIFKSSNEAAYYLATVCEKNGWNMLYKPHPICVEGEREEIKTNLPESAYLIEKCNINSFVECADVVITILSTTAYVSLIQEKPTIMLGYTQLKDDDSVYQAFEKDKIEETIKEAIENGYSALKRKSFINHLARTIKYYVYDDMTERSIRFGKDLKQIFEKGLEY